MTLLAMAFAGNASALVTDATIENKILENEVFRHVTILDSDIKESSIEAATVENSRVSSASISKATIRESYLRDLTVERALIEDTRVEDATILSSTLRDATVCDVAVNGFFNVGTCRLVTIDSGDAQVFARLPADAPATVAPGASYDLVVRDAVADTLTVRNDPGGLVGLNFKTAQDPLGLQKLGFVAAAEPDSVESLQLLVDGEIVETFSLGETIDLPSGDFTLRVNVAKEGIIDGARLGLVLNLDDRELRPRITSFDVIATELVIPPLEEQPFAPFFADDLARLVISLPMDDNGNIDRDVNVSARVDVTSVDTEQQELVGDVDEHARLHDDSRVFSSKPFFYLQEVDAAHHPQTLELLARLTRPADIDYGTINFHGTHLVAISPFATNVTFSAETMNAHGETLTAQIDIPMPETNEEQREVTFFGTTFELPGEGTLLVNFVDENGEPVEAEDGWALFIEETPTSHQVEQRLGIESGATSVTQELAESIKARAPFGNFLPSEYLVCVDHDGERDCARGGDLVPIRANETTVVTIVIE